MNLDPFNLASGSGNRTIPTGRVAYSPPHLDPFNLGNIQSRVASPQPTVTPPQSSGWSLGRVMHDIGSAPSHVYNVGKGMATSLGQSAHTVYTADISNPARLAAAEITHNNPALQNVGQSIMQNSPSKVIGAGLNLASTVAPMAKGGSLLARAATGYGAGAAISGTQAKLGGASTTQALQQAGIGGALYAAPVVGAGILGRALNNAKAGRAAAIAGNPMTPITDNAHLLGPGDRQAIQAPVAPRQIAAPSTTAGPNGAVFGAAATRNSAQAAVPSQMMQALNQVDKQLMDVHSGRVQMAPQQVKDLFQTRQRLAAGDTTALPPPKTPQSTGAPTISGGKTMAATTEPNPSISSTTKSPAVPPPITPSPNAVKAGGSFTTGFNERLAPKTSVLDRGTPSAQNLGNDIRNVDRTQNDLATKYYNQVSAGEKLSKAEQANIGAVVRGEVKPSSAAQAKVAEAIRNTSPQVRQSGIDAGLNIGDLGENYYPGELNHEMIKNNPQEVGAIHEHLVKTGQAPDKNAAASLFSKYQKTRPNTFGHFEMSKSLDLPSKYYKNDFGVYKRYLEAASQRTAEAQHLGPNLEVAQHRLQQIEAEGGNHKLATKTLDRYLHDASAGNDPLAKARAGYSFARLGTASLSHLGQSSNVALAGDTKALLKGLSQHFSGDHKGFVEDTGVTRPAMLHGMRDQATSITGHLSKFTAPKLSNIMAHNRSIAALGGRDFANRLAAKGDAKSIQKLQSYGVQGDIGKKLSYDQQVQAARGFTKESMFGGSRADTPIGAETATGKTIGQYRLSYAYKQTRLLYNNVVKEAQNGNFKPLVKLMAISAPITGVTITAKRKISGSKQGPGGNAMDAAGALGGIPGELAVQLGRHFGGHPASTVAGAIAPLAGEGVSIAEAAGKAVGTSKIASDKGKALGQYGLRTVPIVGGRLANTLLPNNPVGQTITGALNKDSVVTNTLKTAGYSVANPKQTQRGTALSDGQYKNFINQSTAAFMGKVRAAQADPGFQSLSKGDQKKTVAKALSDARAQTLDKLGVAKPPRATRGTIKHY